MTDPTKYIWREPTEEQLRTFWNWCGFKFSESEVLFGNEKVFTAPDGKVIKSITIELSLDLMFEYAIPKLSNHGFTLQHSVMADFISNVYMDRNIDELRLGLFWSIWEHAGIGER